MVDNLQIIKARGPKSGRARASNPKRDLLMEKWGKRMKVTRERLLGYENASDFAADIGIEPATYRTYERGESLPPIDVLERIADISGMSLDHLLLDRQLPRRVTVIDY